MNVSQAGIGNRYGPLTPFGFTSLLLFYIRLTYSWQKRKQDMFGRRSRLATTLPCVAALVALPLDSAAQSEEEPFEGEVFLWALLAEPLGEFRDRVAGGIGGGLGAFDYPSDRRHVALRAEGSFVLYGIEGDRRPLSPTIPVDSVNIASTSWLLMGRVGPQVFLFTGPIRPYVYGTVGLSCFLTRTDVFSDYEDEHIATTTNFRDLNLLLSAGAGLSVKLFEKGDRPFHLDLTAVYIHNGRAKYLAADGLRELPGGGWVADPVESGANLITYRVGVSFEPG